MNSINYEIKPLTEILLSEKNSFDCGNEALNQYLYERGYDDPTAVTYVALCTDNEDIIGYFSLSCGAIYQKISSDPIEKYEHYPAVEIKNFAVDIKYQHIQDKDGDTLSSLILQYVKQKLIMDFTENICGANRILLYSVPDAVGFYKRAGFVDFARGFIKSNIRFLEGCWPLVYNY